MCSQHRSCSRCEHRPRVDAGALRHGVAVADRYLIRILVERCTIILDSVAVAATAARGRGRADLNPRQPLRRYRNGGLNPSRNCSRRKSTKIRTARGIYGL